MTRKITAKIVPLTLLAFFSQSCCVSSFRLARNNIFFHIDLFITTNLFVAVFEEDKPKHHPGKATEQVRPDTHLVVELN